MTKARRFVNKGKRLEERLFRLQADLYDFANDLEDSGLLAQSQLATESGFELDISQQKMNTLWTGLENAFCRKVTTE